jgi:prepilin peptidase CpaA
MTEQFTGSVPNMLRLALLVALLGTALYTDLRYGKIYNKLTLSCTIIGIIVNTYISGVHGLLLSLGGAALVLGLFLLFAKVGGIGGGDIKLMMAVGALMGFNFMIRALLLSAVAGGLLAVAVIARRRLLATSIKNLANGVASSVMYGVPLDFSKYPAESKFKYSPAIVAGTLLTLLIRV